MPVCLIGLGSNQGNRRQLLETAVACIAASSQVQGVALSSWRETSPVGGPPGQPFFLNGALAAETSLSPQALLAGLQQIEHDLGRRRGEHWAQRTIDLDLLLYDDLVCDAPGLQLPHPRMAWRRFVLEPAAEVAGAMMHPITGWSVARLLEHLNTTPAYVAVTGPIAAGKTRLARRLAEALSAELIVETPNWPRLAVFYADPASHGWQIELEFLNQRVQLLAAVSPPGASGLPSARTRWIVSDFWFDQSRAFARVWLPPEQRSALLERWQQQRRDVVRPKLVVLLDAPAETLLARTRARGRSCEQQISEAQLEGIRQAILDEAGRPDVGPVLRLRSDDHEAVLAEVLAAVGAME
jgi:2-amino-4-hydroxy-6-hydroxymethyldihydropteridine diphosphokinase